MESKGAILDAYQATDEELGKRICELAEKVNFSPRETSAEDIAKEIRAMFDHCCQGQIDAGLAKDVRMFARYMKDAWGTPEGESCLVRAMNVLGRFRRHEQRLSKVVEANEDCHILAACQMIEDSKRSEP